MNLELIDSVPASTPGNDHQEDIFGSKFKPWDDNIDNFLWSPVMKISCTNKNTKSKRNKKLKNTSTGSDSKTELQKKREDLKKTLSPSGGAKPQESKISQSCKNSLTILPLKKPSNQMLSKINEELKFLKQKKVEMVFNRDSYSTNNKLKPYKKSKIDPKFLKMSKESTKRNSLLQKVGQKSLEKINQIQSHSVIQKLQRLSKMNERKAARYKYNLKQSRNDESDRPRMQISRSSNTKKLKINKSCVELLPFMESKDSKLSKDLDPNLPKPNYKLRIPNFDSLSHTSKILGKHIPLHMLQGHLTKPKKAGLNITPHNFLFKVEVKTKGVSGKKS
ncbi:unnamed protein product [Moneuplotes crassus]|uniref:Uncharacterized protein n=1 Tax=Euplotes crassus TaxID=5936 RepID=A0AAD1UNK9_EUPCR|nr:unnamed protein product [Moneuplotes crassus]